MRSCVLAESSTKKSAASDITLVLLSRSPVLITRITHLGHVQTAPQDIICLNVETFLGVMALNAFRRFEV